MGCCGGGSPKKKGKDREMDKNLSPIDLLKTRLAKGEISFDEYKETKAVLSE